MAHDIPSISDLEAIQLLNKHYAEVITSKKDGVSSAADITQTTNPITGVTRRTLYKILDDMDDTFLERLLKMAFTPVGTFTAGATLTDARQTLLWEVSEGGDGHYYSWSGSFPKVVNTSSTPTPLGAGAWVDRSDVTLRSDLASESGSGLVGYKPAGNGAVQSNVGENLDNFFVNAINYGIVADATFPLVRGAAGGTDATAAVQAAIDATANYGTLYIPPGEYKLTGLVTCNKPINVMCEGVFFASGTGGFLFQVGSTGGHVTSLTQVKIEGIKLVYTDKDQTRTGITIDRTQTATVVQRCMVSSEWWVNGVHNDLFNTPTADGFHSFCGIKTSRNYNVRIVDCVATNCLTGFCFETSNDNWGNTQFENLFALHCGTGWSMDSTDGVVGLSDSISITNITSNAYDIHNPSVAGTVTVASAVSIGDTTITIDAGSVAAYDAAQNGSNNGLVPLIHPAIGWVLYSTGRSGTTINLARPATRAISGGVLHMGTAGIVTALPTRPMGIVNAHLEKHTYGYVGCGTNGASVMIDSSMFSTNLQLNPILLLGGENYIFKNNVYENGSGAQPAFVRIAYTDSSGGGGTGEYFKNVMILAPATAYFDPSKILDRDKIVSYDVGVTFRASIIYRKNNFGIQNSGDSLRYPLNVENDAYQMRININNMLEDRFAIYANTTFNNTRFAQWDFHVNPNTYSTTCWNNVFYEGGVAKYAINYWSTAFTVNDATPPASTPSRPTIYYNMPPAAGGWLGWVWTGAAWKRFGAIEP